MGLRLLTVTLASLIMLGFIDAFFTWYRQFLDRQLPFPGLKPLLMHLIWITLALIFWLHLYYRHQIFELDMSHFLFAAFIYSVKGLVTSFVQRKKTTK